MFMLTINSVFIRRKMCNYIVNLFSNRNMNLAIRPISAKNLKQTNASAHLVL